MGQGPRGGGLDARLVMEILRERRVLGVLGEEKLPMSRLQRVLEPKEGEQQVLEGILPPCSALRDPTGRTGAASGAPDGRRTWSCWRPQGSSRSIHMEPGWEHPGAQSSSQGLTGAPGVLEGALQQGLGGQDTGGWVPTGTGAV